MLTNRKAKYVFELVLPLSNFGSSWWKWKMTSAFRSFPGTVFVHNFFMKNTWYVNCGVVPSLEGRAFLIQSVKWRTKSKKKSPSGTEMTLSAILTKREKPSLERRFSRCAMLWQKSLARVLESTSKAWERKATYFHNSLKTLIF